MLPLPVWDASPDLRNGRELSVAGATKTLELLAMTPEERTDAGNHYKTDRKTWRLEIATLRRDHPMLFAMI